jgi:DNA-binding transcriptional ArsR family regulator
MKPLYHPPASEITVEGLLYALSDPVRVQIFMEIAYSDCPKTCSSLNVVKDKALPKSTLSQHFKVLREAGLVRSERKGVEMHNASRCRDLKERFGPLIENILKAYAIQNEPKKSAKAR